MLQPWLASDEIRQAGPEQRADPARALAVDERLVDADLDLEGPKALRLLLAGVAQIGGKLAVADDAEERDAASPLAAEERIGRPVGGAADQIVQRHLDGGLGGVVAVHAAGHRRQRAGDVLRRPAHERRRQIGDRRHHALDRLAGHGRRGGGLAPADDAVVGFDADEHVVGLPDLDARHEDRLLHRQADRDRLDALDLHGCDLLSSCVLFELDQGAEKIAGMDEGDPLAGDVVLRLAVAEHADAASRETARTAFSTSSTPRQK